MQEHGLQCGFCTPGMLMSAKALLASNATPTDDEIRLGISGNLCRCTGYVNIVKAIQFGAARLRGEVLTVEGLYQNGALHPMQAAFSEKHGLQCGFCTPGMMISSIALLEHNPHPTEDEIRWGLSGNLCRCTGYVNIVKAVQQAAEKMSEVAK